MIATGTNVGLNARRSAPSSPRHEGSLGHRRKPSEVWWGRPAPLYALLSVGLAREPSIEFVSSRVLARRAIRTCGLVRTVAREGSRSGGNPVGSASRVEGRRVPPASRAGARALGAGGARGALFAHWHCQHRIDTLRACGLQRQQVCQEIERRLRVQIGVRDIEPVVAVANPDECLEWRRLRR